MKPDIRNREHRCGLPFWRNVSAEERRLVWGHECVEKGVLLTLLLKPGEQEGIRDESDQAETECEEGQSNALHETVGLLLPRVCIGRRSVKPPRPLQPRCKTPAVRIDTERRARLAHQRVLHAMLRRSDRGPPGGGIRDEEELQTDKRASPPASVVRRSFLLGEGAHDRVFLPFTANSTQAGRGSARS